MAEQTSESRSVKDEVTTIQPAQADLEAQEIQKHRTSNDPAGEATYSSFTPKQKIFIILMASISTFFSPLTANIYFPALNTIANDLHVTNTLVNLTVTTYMIFQGLAPSIVGGLSDSLGRRPAYILCFVLYIMANIALGAQNSYAALLVLRCFQSAGISGTVALANAVVADVVTSAERGIYIGWASVGGALGPAISPILGGILSQYLGYHSVFWFLAIFGGTFFLLLLLFFPETCRKVVGDGSVPPPIWSKSLLNYFHERRRANARDPIDFSARDALTQQRSFQIPNPITATLSMIIEKETGLLLIFSGIVYAGTYAILAGIPSQFAGIYGFNDLQVGLVFLPIGIGCLIAAFTQGKLLDWNYARHCKRLGLPVTKTRQQDLSNFPIERARVEISIPITVLGALCMIAYGWVLQFEVHIAAPIIILFLQGYALLASFNALSILIVDIHPKSAATATAAVNLVRCLLGAGATAVVLPMLDALGRGWAYTFVGLVWILFCPLLLAIIKWGPQWRCEIRAKEEREREEKESQNMNHSEMRS